MPCQLEVRYWQGHILEEWLEINTGLEITLNRFRFQDQGGHGMPQERVLEFSCPIKIKLILPKDCVLDEKALKERIGQLGPQLFMGLCDACPHFLERDKG